VDKLYRHLKDHNYYSELYDRVTIEECQRWENSKYPEKSGEGELEKTKAEYFRKVVVPLGLYYLTADRAAKKSEAIQEWMRRDQIKDEKVANAVEPNHVRCLGCSSLLVNCTSRDLMSNHEGKDSVLFMFECGKCHKRRAFWENGKEWEYIPKCEKCRSEVTAESIRKDGSIISRYSCSQCGHTETDTLNLEENKEKKIDPNFESNRKKYCISEQEGVKIMQESQEMKDLVDKFKDKEDHKDFYDAVARIRRLTIVELQTLLAPLLEKAGYAKLEFEKPDLQKDVILGFNVQDAESGRGDYDSRHDLQRLLKEALSPTNWRLMSDGVSYRLGFLQGRLRGIEGEDALKNMIQNKINSK